jgi:polyisoprenoid-binding protein YceI
MTPKRNRTLLFLLPLLLLVAVVIWACSTTTQQSNAPVTQEQPAAASPDTSAADTTTLTTDTAATTAQDSVASSADTSATVRVFTIDQSQSAARFTLDEELMGSPKTVVGATSLVNGEITIDLADMTKTTISTIQIDASDFTTDSSRRDGAIQRFILGTNNEDYRYIVFTPTAIDELPAAAKPGDTFELQITGDLTISGVTKPVTFVTTVTVDSDTQISGLAKAQVLRSDYNLTIPSVPSVANVTDEVLSELQFIADAA